MNNVQQRHIWDSTVKHFVFHGTYQHFDTFAETRDIGFHFGDEIAAKERMKVLAQADVDIEEVGPNQLEIDCSATLRGALGESPVDRIYGLLLRKLDHPKPSLRHELQSMSPNEYRSLISEYEVKPDSENFLVRAKRGDQQPGFSVKINGDLVETVDSEAEAEQIAAQARKRLKQPRKALIRLINPIELPDLGIWPAFEIAMVSGLSAKELQRVRDADVEEAMYDVLRRILKSKGHDGIRYINLVENKGSTSYIVFDADQILTEP